MSAFFSDPAVGGNGTTTTDDRDPVTGLDAGGWKTRFVPALAQVVAIGNWVRQRALQMVGYVEAADESAGDAADSAASAFDFSVIADAEADRAQLEADRAKEQADRAEQLAGSVDPKEISDIVGLPAALATRAPLALTLAAAGADLDTFMAAGRLLVDGPVHGPGAGKYIVAVDPDPGAADIVLQRATRVDISPPREYLRSLAGAAWSLWGRVRVEPIVVRITANTLAVPGRHYKLGASLVLTFPVAPIDGDIVGITNESGTLTCALDPNGKSFNGNTESMVVDLPNVTLEFQYEASTGRWWA